MIITVIGALGLFLVLWAGLSVITIWTWRKIDTRYFGTCYE